MKFVLPATRSLQESRNLLTLPDVLTALIKDTESRDNSEECGFSLEYVLLNPGFPGFFTLWYMVVYIQHPVRLEA